MRSPRRNIRTAVVAVTALVLTVSACTAQKKTDTGSAGAGASSTSGAASPAASARGVTADTIKIGIVYPDLASIRQYVNIDHGDYEAVYKALIQRVNDAGGINGRKIEPVFGKLNLVSPAASTTTCVSLTEDQKVFAVLGNASADEPLCYVKDHSTAFIGGDLNAARYAQAKAPWFSHGRGGDEIADGMGLFNADISFASKKVAVLSNVNDQAVMNNVAIPALAKLGVTPVQTGVLDAPAQDPAAVGQQTGVFIQKFTAAGADTVVLVGSIGASFPQVLEHTQYRPRLLFTDYLQAEGYISDKGKHDYTTLTGAEALGLSQKWNAPNLQDCMTYLETALPDLKGKLTIDPATVPAGQPNPIVSATVACQFLNLFKAIATKAGKDLNYQTFQAAGFALGPYSDPGYTDQATYSKDSPAGNIPVRLFKYDAATKQFTVSAS